MNGKTRQILIALAVVLAVSSVMAAPRKRKAKEPRPAPPPAQVQRDPAPLDRLLYEAVTSFWGRPLPDNPRPNMTTWDQERTRICTQPDNEEYDFFVRLRAATKIVTSATTASEAVKGLKELDDFIRGAIADSKVRELFGCRDGRGNGYLREITEHRRATPKNILEYMLSETSSKLAKRMIEGWLASRDNMYVDKLAKEVLESGFSPGAMDMERLRYRYDRSSGANVDRRCFNYAVKMREEKSEKLFEFCKRISTEVNIICNAVSVKGKTPIEREKVIKASLTSLDNHVQRYADCQVVEFVEHYDYTSADESAMKLEIKCNYENLLRSISDSISSPRYKQIVDKRLDGLRRQIESDKDKMKKMRMQP